MGSHTFSAKKNSKKNEKLRREKRSQLGAGNHEEVVTPL